MGHFKLPCCEINRIALIVLKICPVERCRFAMARTQSEETSIDGKGLDALLVGELIGIKRLPESPCRRVDRNKTASR